MPECQSCQEQVLPSKRYLCPANGQNYSEVAYSTILYHIKTPWEKGLKQQRYYFCDDPACDVVYFGADDSVIEKSQLRTPVCAKEANADAVICYCFGVTRAQAQSDRNIKDFVIEQTRNGTCSCEVTNPSGRCCLKDFPK